MSIRFSCGIDAKIERDTFTFRESRTCHQTDRVERLLLRLFVLFPVEFLESSIEWFDKVRLYTVASDEKQSRGGQKVLDVVI